MIPLAFTDAVWLWLVPPALAVVVIGWLAAARLLPRIRRIASLAIRILLVLALGLVLAGARLALPSDRLAVVFLIDGSASMVPATRDAVIDFARTSVSKMPAGDLAGVVVFGSNALVDRLPSEVNELQTPASVPVVGSTDIAAAVRLGAAIMPAGTQQRLVLLSDGNDTGGDAGEAIAAAAGGGVHLDVVLPSGDTYAEALVDGLDAPSGARVGESIELTARLRTTVATSATLRLLADGGTVATRVTDLQPGSREISFTVKASTPGFHVFRAVLEPRTDHFAQNNAADAYVLVSGEPQILLATDDAARAADLVASLRAAREQVSVVPRSGVPSSLASLAGYDAVVLDNVAAADLGPATMAALQVYVRDLGKGLVMLGGRRAYGAGGYLNTPIEQTLPVYMTVRDRTRNPDVALVAVVDKSGSMADCHCTGDNRGTAQGGQRGFQKVDIAKEAILRAADALAPSDQLGVVAFDSSAHWAVHTGPIDLNALQGSLGFTADGQTNIYAGLKAAYDDLVKNPAKLRHIILITDGWSQSGAYDQFLADLKKAGITLSTIGTGGGSAHILRTLAEESGGRYYDAADATTIPDIFLKETIQTAGERIVEERFQPVPSSPSEILRGMDASRLPVLLGYNATTAKGTATVALLTARQDPLLAQWQYGLGRAVAWTSDARQQWAGQWIGTPEFGTLTAQLVSWVLPPQDEQGIDVRFTPGRNGQLGVEVTSLDDQGAPRNFFQTVVRLVGPDLTPVQTTLRQIGPGRYAGSLRADQQGAYLVRVAQTRPGAPSGSRTLGLVSPAAEEYRRLGVDREALDGFARAGAGRPISTQAISQIWRHDIRADAFPTPIWPWLLVLAILLVPLDVGVRRVALMGSDLRRARAWIARRVGLGSPEPEVVPGLAELRAAKSRSVRRAERSAPESVREPGGVASGAPHTAAGGAPNGAAAPARRPTAAFSKPARWSEPVRPANPADPAVGTAETLAARLARRRRSGR